MNTRNHTSSERSADPTRTVSFLNPLFQGVEAVLEQGMQLTADLLIEGLGQTTRVLNRSEELGRQVGNLMQKLGDAHQETRHTTQMLLKESIQDGVTLCNEFIHGMGQVARSAIHEVEEIGKQGQTIGGSVRDTFQDLPNPFRTRSARKPKGKEPTIIPISIQDN
jgi:hypothetical protein